MGVFGRYVAGNKGLCIFSRKFGVLDRFKSIDSNFSRDIAKKGKDLFC